MSRANSTFLIVLGAQRIDCAVMEGDAWRPGSVQCIPFEPQADAMLAALQQLIDSSSESVSNAAAVINSDSAAVTDTATKESRGKKHSAIQPSAITQIRVLISDLWLPTICVPWSPACMTAVESHAYAQMQLRAAGFELSVQDEIRLDDVPYGQPRVAVTYPAALLEALSNLARRMQARLVSVLPLSLAGWRYAQPSLAANGSKQQAVALAMLEDQQVTFVRCAGEQLLQLMPRSLRHAGGDSTPLPHAGSAALTQWQRIQLRDPQAAATKALYIFSLEQAVSTEKDVASSTIWIDFPEASSAIVPVPRTLQLARCMATLRHSLGARGIVQDAALSLGRWVLIGLALTLAVGSVFSAFFIINEVKTLQQQRASAEARATREVTRPVAYSREEKNRIAAVNSAIRQLNLPVAALLQAMQPPKDIRVALLGVDMAGKGQTDGATGHHPATLKITAEARTGAEMASYVAFLAERRPFVAAYLARHEIVENQTEQPYRFTVEAIWEE